jgi:hypothetical protein
VVRTLEDVRSDLADRLVPRGSVGTVVECYGEPEGYAVDLAIPDARLVGGTTYANVILGPEQLEVLEPALAARPKPGQEQRRGQATAQQALGAASAPVRR